MNPFELSEYISVLVTLLFLSIGAILDIKTREVPDKVWLVYGPLGLVLTLFRLALDPSQLILTLISMGVSVLLAFVMVYFGLFGGADGKALMCLGVTIPLSPTITNPIIGYVYPFFPLVVIILSYVCSVLTAFWILGNNLKFLAKKRKMFEGLEHESLWRKALALITGYHATLNKLRSTFYLYPMEEVCEDQTGAHRRLLLYFNADVERDELVAEFTKSIQKVGSPSQVWVSPGLPMLFFVLIAAVIVLIVGDPIFGSIFLLSRQ